MSWAKITVDNIARINGNTEKLIRTLRKGYTYIKTQTEIEINQWFDDQEEFWASQ